MFISQHLTETATENFRALTRANEAYIKDLPNLAALTRAVTSGNAAYADYRSVANAASAGVVMAMANTLALAPGAIFVLKDILSNVKTVGVEIPTPLVREFNI